MVAITSRLFVCWLLACAIVAARGSSRVTSLPPVGASVDGEFLVMYPTKDSMRVQEISTLLDQYNIVVQHTTHTEDSCIMHVQGLLEHLQAVRAILGTAFHVEPVVELRAQSGHHQNTYQELAPWHLDRIDQPSGFNGAYTYGRTGKGVHVYVIDSGVNPTLPEFGNRATWDFDSVEDGSSMESLHFHGTHVAGIVGSETYGVAKEASIHSVRMLDSEGRGTSARFLSCLSYIRDNFQSPAVLSISVGGTVRSPSIDALLRHLLLSNITVVIAAGNDSGDACDYSLADTTESSYITVGASTQRDKKLPISNSGPCVTIYSPGELVESLDPKGVILAGTGTSQATPIVAGVVALLLEDNPQLDPDTIKSKILEHSGLKFIQTPFPTELPANYTPTQPPFASSAHQHGLDMMVVLLVIVLACLL